MKQAVTDSGTTGNILEAVLQEFVLHLKYTFGDIIQYIGTTTDLNLPPRRIRDIDIIVVFSIINESHISYVWRIINKLHAKYSISLDTRIFSREQLNSIPLINRYLLKIFLNNQLGENPFDKFSSPMKDLKKECIKKIADQENQIVSTMPRIAGNPDYLKALAQSVCDAIRAYLIIDDHPIAGKEEACRYFSENYPGFADVASIYDGYLEPNSIIDVGNYIFDSLGVVKHLLYKAQMKPLANEVLLVNTPSSVMPHPRDDYLSYDHNMPLGLICLASYLGEKKLPIRILDAYAENLGVLSVVDKIFTGASVPTIIGFNSSSPNIHIVHKTAGYLKRIRPELTVVSGGPHASLAMEHALSTGHIDYVIAGEGELPFYKLVAAKFSGERNDTIRNIPGVFSAISGRLMGKHNDELLDLSEIPTPNFGYLPLDRYFSVKRRIYIHTSRGCAFRCIYCSVPECWDKRVREIPMDKLIAQLSSILTSYKPEEIQIVDDNFSHKKGSLIKDFCSKVIEAGLSFRWKCQGRADQLEKEVIELMAKTGCFEVDFGIESGNDQIQQFIRKNLDLRKTLEIISLVHQCGIFSKAFMMLGFPDEAYSQIADTINYAIELKHNGLNDVAFFPVMPFPGTEISRKTGKVVFQGATIDTMDIYERSFAAHRLRKYSAKPEISLNSNFNPESLRLLVKFAYQRFSLALPVSKLKDEFNEFMQMEESALYGL